MARLAKYPKNADASPMPVRATLIQDDSGAFPLQVIQAPLGPDNTPLPLEAQLFVDESGNFTQLATTDFVGGSVSDFQAFLASIAGAHAIGTANGSNMQTELSVLGSQAAQMIAPDGRLWHIDPTVNPVMVDYGMPASRIGRMTFTRSGTGEIVGGGARTSFATDEPRIGNGGFYIDGGGTNLLLWTEDFTKTEWDKDELTLGTAGAGPAGAGTAAFLVPSTNNTEHDVRQTVSSTSIHQTASAWAKAGGYNFVRLFMNADGSHGGRADFDLSNGTVSSVFGNQVGDVATASIFPVDTAEGGYDIELKVTLASAPTQVIFYSYPMHVLGTTAFAGDGTSGVYLAKPQLLAQTASASYIKSTGTRGTRAAEMASFVLPYGGHLSRVVDQVGETLTTFVSNVWNVTAQPGAFRITEAETYILTIFDNFVRDDTDPGDLGTAQDGDVYTLLTYDTITGEMVPAPTARIEDNEVVADAGDTYYAVRSVPPGQKVRHMSASFKFYPEQVNPGTFTNTAAALAPCAAPSLPAAGMLAELPIHISSGTDNTTVTSRAGGGAFNDRAQILISQGDPNDGVQTHTVTMDVHGNVITINRDGLSLSYEDATAVDALQEFGFFEKHEDFPNTNAEVRFVTSFNMESYPMGSAGDSTPAVPINVPDFRGAGLGLPHAIGTPAVGTTFKVSVYLGTWISNAGVSVFTPRWQKNGVDIAGAPGAGFELDTSSGFVATDVIRCRLTPSNDVGTGTPVYTPNVTLT